MMASLPHLPMSLPFLLVVIITLQAGWSPSEACSCLQKHPQAHFCQANWVIKANVKTERIITVQETYPGHDGRMVNYTKRLRMQGVKISKVYKEAEGFEQGGFVRLYSEVEDSLCGTRLQVNQTYVVHGNFYSGRPTFTICDQPMQWNNIPPIVRKGFGYLYKRNCFCMDTACQRNPACGCVVRPDLPWKEKQCFYDHAVCVQRNNNEIDEFPSTENPCMWSRRGQFYRCRGQARNRNRPFEWEP